MERGLGGIGMKFVIITGLSGAGKSEVLKVLEDQGFYCIANLPPVLLKDFVELTISKKSEFKNVALLVNTKEGDAIKEFFRNLEELNNMDINYETLFLEASDRVLTKRFKELRRPHPFNPNGGIIKGIELERKELEDIKKKADHIIDTSNMTLGKLKEEVTGIFLEGSNSEKLSVSVVSFGFKKGIPMDIDLLFDVRFLPNPYYIDELRPLTGNDQEVREYVMGFEESQTFLEKLKNMVEYLIPYYIKEGKSQLIIGIGCTGGRHRSVTIANELYEYLSEKQFRVTVNHREQEK
jgi:RNase adapter protein RapZ